MVTPKSSLCAREVKKSYLVQVMKGNKGFCPADHQTTTQTAKAEIKSQRATTNNATLVQILSGQ
jgi:hypothetical protein